MIIQVRRLPGSRPAQACRPTCLPCGAQPCAGGAVGYVVGQVAVIAVGAPTQLPRKRIFTLR